jgi:integrase
LFTAERYDPMHAALAVLLGVNGLPVSEACGANIEDLAVQRGHRTRAILAKGNNPAVIPLAPPDGAHPGSRYRGTSRRADPVSPGRAAARSSHGAPVGSLNRPDGPAVASCIRTCCGRGSSWPPSTARVPLRDVQLAARHADPRTTTIYDRRRENFDRHAAYVVVAFVAGG